ncbi:MAG TPA: STAS domain-containing protein [Pseudonocardia sp.]|jgi:anti-sigma B factor antagonist
MDAGATPGTRAPDGSVRDGLTVRLVTSGRTVVMHVTGEIDMTSVARLRDATADLAAGLAERSVSLVVLDLSEVAYMGSAGMAWLVESRQRVGERNAALRVVASAPALTRPLNAVGLLAVLDVRPTLAAALDQN